MPRSTLVENYARDLTQNSVYSVSESPPSSISQAAVRKIWRERATAAATVRIDLLLLRLTNAMAVFAESMALA